MSDLIFATGNQAKIAQLEFMVNHLEAPLTVVNGKHHYGDAVEYEEYGQSVEEVARDGALEVFARLGIPVATEDSDFRVEALDWYPGIRAGGATPDRGTILERMQGKSNRRAVISSAVAYANPEGESQVWLHQVWGEITDQERYDPALPFWISPQPDNPYGGGFNAIFVPDGWEQTLAEIGPEQAMPWSYREKNFQELVTYLSSEQDQT